MKARLNITIDDGLLSNVKAYAIKQQTSVSALIENYFRTLERKPKKESFLTKVEKLKKPSVNEGIDLKEAYYKTRAKKYGF